ncbi:hypothetical protein ACU4GD_11180 [Cupriavidus basilensis]
MVAAIAFESLVKLAAFLSVGIFVTFGLYDGFGDLFGRAGAVPALKALLTLDGGAAGGGTVTFGRWAALVFLSMLSILLLPRQFQIAVVENVDENHLRKAIWLLPLTSWRSISLCCRSLSQGCFAFRAARSTRICSCWRCRCRKALRR